MYISSTLILQSLTCVCLGSLSYTAKEPNILFLNNNFNFKKFKKKSRCIQITFFLNRGSQGNVYFQLKKLIKKYFEVMGFFKKKKKKKL